MKRYELHDDCYGDQVEDESPYGKWVRYEEAQAELDAMRAAHRRVVMVIEWLYDMGFCCRADIDRAFNETKPIKESKA